MSDTAASGPRPRTKGDEQLLAAMGEPGCPMCRHVAEVAPRYLDSLLYQHTTDRAYRDRFLAGGGFCARHIRAAVLADSAGNGDGVGAAIFVRSQLAARRRALAAAGGFRTARRLREATRPAWDCPVCEHEITASESAASQLVERSVADPAWRDTVASAAWCLAHLGHLLAAADQAGGGVLDGLKERQLAQMDELDGRLEALAHDSSHGRRDRLTEEVRTSLEEAADVLAGSGEDGADVRA